MMFMDMDAVKSLIVDAIPEADVSIDDLRGDGAQYHIIVSSPYFADKTRLEQHRLIHRAIKNFVGNTIHRISLRTFTPRT